MVKRCLILWAFKMREFHDIKSWNSKQVFVAHVIPKMQILWSKCGTKIFIPSALPSNQTIPYCKVHQENTSIHNESEPAVPWDHAIFSFHLIKIWPDHVQRKTMKAAKIWLDVTLERKCESCLNSALSGYGRLNSWEWRKFCLIQRKRESRKFAKIFAWSNEVECIRRSR